MIKNEFYGTAKVFRNDYETKNGGTFARYSVGFGKKLQDGNYENAYMTAKFKKGVELENMTDIEINQAWLTFDKYEKNGKTQTAWALFINDFDLVEEEQKKKQERRKRSQEEAPVYADAFEGTDDAIPF